MSDRLGPWVLSGTNPRLKAEYCEDMAATPGMDAAEAETWQALGNEWRADIPPPTELVEAELDELYASAIDADWQDIEPE